MSVLRLLPFFRLPASYARWAAWIILVSGIIGSADSFYLVLQYMAALATDGDLTPCSPNTFINCTKTVQGSWAHLLGVPNPMLGMLWYSGWVLFGASRLLGTSFHRKSRVFCAIVLLAGAVFSYTLYLASILALRGVCPFCLLSTSLSTLILLSFVIDDTSYVDTLVTKRVRRAVTVFQVFSAGVFVIGLPLFLYDSMRWMIDATEAMKHWSFPVILALIAFMAAAHVTAYKTLRRTAR